MKTTSRTMLLLLALWLPPAAPAAAAGTEPPGIAAQIDSWMKEMIDSAQKLNLEKAFSRLSREEGGVFFLNDKPFKAGEFIEHFREAYARLKRQSFEVSSSKVIALGPDAALWVGSGQGASEDKSGTFSEGPLAVSCLWQKAGEKWEITHFHESFSPAAGSPFAEPPEPEMEPKPASPHAAPSGREVVAFVEKAAAYAKANGRENALSAFMNPKGPFRREDLFIFAYDSSGTVLAHGGQPFLVGKNLIDMVDADGVEVLKELIALAGKGGGWLEYLWPDPDNGNAIEPKADYVLKVDDSWWLGSGRFENAKGDYLK